MRRPLATAFLAALAVAAPALAGDAAVSKGPWDGFGEGSWVLQKMSAKVEMPGMDAPSNESVTRQTLVKVTDKAYTVKSEQKVGEEWMGSEMELPRTAATGATTEPTPEELGAEKVSVDGEELPCRKRKVVAAGTETISWVHESKGTLKWTSKGPAGEGTFQVLSFKEKLTVKGKEVVCTKSTTVMKGTQGDSTTTMWSSDAVPGGLVKMETASAMAGMKSTSVVEVTDFEKR